MEKAEYEKLLLENDRLGSYWPDDFNPWVTLPQLRLRFEKLVEVVEKEFGVRCRLGSQPQDATFIGSFGIPSVLTKDGATPSVVASNFGNMITVLGEHTVIELDLERLKSLFQLRGYIFIPQHIRDLKYSGEIEYVDSWTHRFFSYL